jgi:cellulose synthase/poly-beta-1,6-N-acetylglucosamine synthase-like glycosyltransferase
MRETAVQRAEAEQIREQHDYAQIYTESRLKPKLSAVIMMHDAGGNRGQTVGALPQIITRLRARGYRFVTVTAGLHLQAADVPATTSQRLVGVALVVTQQAADHAVAAMAVLLLVATVLTVTRVFLVVGFARVHRRRRARERAQPNAGKPAALNRGIAEARYDILVLVDGDTVFQPDTLWRLADRLRDPAVGAVSGKTKVGNRGGLLGRWQHLEYVMGFNLDRRMFDVLGTIPTVPGAIGAFRRQALAAVGGLSTETLAEDTDLTMAICRSPWRVTYEESAIAWTEAPSSLRQFWRQRYRWCYGTLQAMWKHRRAVIEHGPSGRFGRRTLTYLGLYHVLLPLIFPVADLALIYGFVFLSPLKVGGFWLAFNLLQLLTCGYALRLDRERLGTLWALPLQQFVYRQLLCLVTIQSVIAALLGTRQRWQVMRRAGVFAAGSEPAG